MLSHFSYRKLHKKFTITKNNKHAIKQKHMWSCQLQETEYYMVYKIIRGKNVTSYSSNLFVSTNTDINVGDTDTDFHHVL